MNDNEKLVTIYETLSLMMEGREDRPEFETILTILSGIIEDEDWDEDED